MFSITSTQPNIAGQEQARELRYAEEVEGENNFSFLPESRQI